MEPKSRKKEKGKAAQETLANAKREREALKLEIDGLKQEIADLQILLENHADYDKLETTGNLVEDHHAQQEEAKVSNERSRIINIARKKFNQNPNHGIKYLWENKLLGTDAKSVANFLYAGKPLCVVDDPEIKNFSYTSIGEYLGDYKPFNLECLKEFVECFSFHNKSFDESLREFLARFRLPGEAQKIDRMMEALSVHFLAHNPGGVLSSADTVYVLAFSTIMLQTDLHNPSVKVKMTAENFVKNNRGINEGGNLPEQFLIDLYNNIAETPLALPDATEDDLSNTFFNPEREGFLTKQGGRRKNWKRRWFILTGNCLYYFKLATDSNPCGIIPLENLDVRDIVINGKRHCFEIYNPIESSLIKACKTTSGVVSEGHHLTYVISAPSEEEKDIWMSSIRRAAIKDPFYELLKMRRERCLTSKR